MPGRKEKYETTRPVPWDEMPRHYAPNKKELQAQPKVKPVEVEVRSVETDLKAIGIRATFGIVTGSLTGGVISTVEVLRDVKAMTIDRKITTMKILRFSGLCGGFFGCYHGFRKAFQFYFPQPSWEDNIALAASVTVTPLLLAAPGRKLLPYAVMMVVLDAFNEYTEHSK